MGATTRKIQVLTVDLEAKPGSLSRVYQGFRESGVNILASWGYEMGPGSASAHFYTGDLPKAEKVLKQMGLKARQEGAVWAEGEDKIGTYADLLGKIAKANVNLGATDAFSLNGKFATVFFSANEKEYPSLCKALGC